jgi:enamine deaminase RidA (YjgF/YER057c/UK114 family)
LELCWTNQTTLAHSLLVGRLQTMQGYTESKLTNRPGPEDPGPRLWSTPPRDARPLMVGSLRHGYEWQDEIGHFCLLTNVVPTLGNGSRSVQASMVFDQLEALLDRVGFAFDQVLRTWFFLDDIFAWYADFNRIRTRFYSERGLLGRAPASTAVGVVSEQHVTLKAHLLAMRPNPSRTTVSVAKSPLQGSAFDYGSAFSRGITLSWPEGKRLYVSGTASIDSGGKTTYPCDTERQIKETLRIVRALLEHHGFGLSEVTVAMGYLADLADAGLLRSVWGQALGIDPSFMRADICRQDLRFELELMAERRPC